MKLRLPVVTGALALLVILGILGSGTASDVAAQSGSIAPGPTVEPIPRTAGSAARYDVKFTNGHEDLIFPQDAIVLSIDRAVHVPSRIPEAEISVRFRHPEHGAGRGVAASVEVARNQGEARSTILTIHPRILDQGHSIPIPAAADVQVVISEGAGLSNPLEGGIYLWGVSTTRDPEVVQARHPDPIVRAVFEEIEGRAAPNESIHKPPGLLIDRTIGLSREGAHTEEQVRLTGRGFTAGTTLAFWRDANFDGIQDADEVPLCQAHVNNKAVAQCEFEFNNPPFRPGFGDCFVQLAQPNSSQHDHHLVARNCNFINGRDGRSHTSILVIDEDMRADNSIESSPQILELEGRVEVGELNRPDPRVFVTLTNFPPGEVISINVGGAEADLATLSESHIPETDSHSFTMELPIGTRAGNLSFKVTTLHNHHRRHEESAVAYFDNTLLIEAAPETVTPNQRIQVSILGYNDSEIDQVLIDGHPLEHSRISGGAANLKASPGGRWLGTIDIPVNQVTTGKGEWKLHVLDTRGRSGELLMKSAPRLLEIEPHSGRPGTQIEISGRGFPAHNAVDGSVFITATYDHGNGQVMASGLTDMHGNFSIPLVLPYKVGVPSTNLVVVEFRDEHGNQVVESVAHHIAAAGITLSDTLAPPGSLIRVTGQGFRSFVPIESVYIGDMDVTPSHPSHTDADGQVSLEIMVPGVSEGETAVSVGAGGTTATAILHVMPLNAYGVAAPVASAFQPLGHNFEVCFYMDNHSKTWQFYDPLMPQDSTLKTLYQGQVYFILVNETTSAILNGKPRNLACYQGNCWSQIVW